jgi:hypothetical protein
MNPEIFEALMLICFGAAWPFSIYRMLRTKKSHGKSRLFLSVILAGYVFGLLFQYFGARNAVIFLYLFNILMVTFDLILTIRYGNTAHSEVNP